MEHADWCAKTARPADPKLRGYADTGRGTTRKVEEAACTCGSNPTASLLRKLRRRGVLR
jgi:hypothetical protein